MRSLLIDVEALTALGVEHGIDTVTELSRRTGVSQWVLYNSLRSGRMQPSHVKAIAETFGVERDQILRTEVSA